MAKIIRPGTTLKTLIGDHIRHVVVTEVEDQNNITVRLGGNDSENPSIVAADRTASTKTRGSLFVQE
jgi:hypothetical protein